MKNLKYLTSLFVFFSLLSLTSFSFSQVVDVSSCRAVEDRLERFDCYESLEEVPIVAVEAVETEVSTVTNENILLPRSTSERAATITEVVSSRAVRDGENSDDLVGKIVALNQALPNRWSITLESGQRWRQVVGRRFALKVGDEVTISPTFWGSAYRLKVARLSGYIQVELVE